jgi:uncharacterized protein (DUF1697 family)
MYPARQLAGSKIIETRLTNLECGNELAEGDDQKVEVEEKLELLVEYKWKESRDAVLLVANNIRRVWRFGC